MKSKKTFLVYVLLCFAVVLTSIATTLALVTDAHQTSDAVIKFGKVSIYADNNGSKLSINVNNLLGNGEVLFDRALLDSEYLYVNPTRDTADCYIRFRLFFTLGNEELDEDNAQVLGYLNDPDYLYKGFVAYNREGQDYGFTPSNGYYYLVTETTGEGRYLKVVTSADYAKNFIMSEKYVLNVHEDHIDAVVNLGNSYDLMLAVEVEAIQCFNVSNLIEENPFGDEILDSSSELTLEAEYGNTTIEDFEKAALENIDNGLPTITGLTLEELSWEQIKVMSGMIEQLYHYQVDVDSTATTFDGGTYTVTKGTNSFTFVNKAVKPSAVTTLTVKDQKTIYGVTYNKTDGTDATIDLKVRIVDFLDDKRDSDANNRIGISFDTVACLPSCEKQMFTLSGEYYSYFLDNCIVRRMLLDKVYPSLAKELQKVIVPAYKESGGIYKAEPIWLMSIAEVGDYNYSGNKTGSYAAFYGSPNDDSIKKKANQNSNGYWTRTPTNSGFYWKCGGQMTTYNEENRNFKAGVAFGFCV